MKFRVSYLSTLFTALPEKLREAVFFSPGVCPVTWPLACFLFASTARPLGFPLARPFISTPMMEEASGKDSLHRIENPGKQTSWTDKEYGRTYRVQRVLCIVGRASRLFSLCG